MSRHIDVEPIEKFIENGLNRKENPFGWQAVEILTEIHYTPTADVAPVRHRHWERVNPANRPTATGTFKCSECGHCYIMRVFEKYNFCPHCGAKMGKEC